MSPVRVAVTAPDRPDGGHRVPLTRRVPATWLAAGTRGRQVNGSPGRVAEEDVVGQVGPVDVGVLGDEVAEVPTEVDPEHQADGGQITDVPVEELVAVAERRELPGPHGPLQLAHARPGHVLFGHEADEGVDVV